MTGWNFTCKTLLNSNLMRYFSPSSSRRSSAAWTYSAQWSLLGRACHLWLKLSPTRTGHKLRCADRARRFVVSGSRIIRIPDAHLAVTELQMPTAQRHKKSDTLHRSDVARVAEQWQGRDALRNETNYIVLQSLTKSSLTVKVDPLIERRRPIMIL